MACTCLEPSIWSEWVSGRLWFVPVVMKHIGAFDVQFTRLILTTCHKYSFIRTCGSLFITENRTHITADDRGKTACACWKAERRVSMSDIKQLQWCYVSCRGHANASLTAYDCVQLHQSIMSLDHLLPGLPWGWSPSTIPSTFTIPLSFILPETACSFFQLHYKSSIKSATDNLCIAWLGWSSS